MAHRDAHKARAAARYRSHQREVIAARRAYRRTAAGMLNDTRHSARQRGNR